MDRTEINTVIYSASREYPDIEKFFGSKGIRHIYIPIKNLEKSHCDYPDADLFLFVLNTDEEKLFSHIKKAVIKKPSILVSRSSRPEFITEALHSGMIDVLPFPADDDQLECQYRRMLYRLEAENMLVSALKTIKYSETRLLEKNTILETILDILSHDSRNIFINLRALIGDLPESPLRGMITANINDLYDELHKAIGYLGHRKRIISVFTTIKNLVITSSRIPLELHKRIIFTHSSRFLLFAECSELFKNAVMNIVENALKYSLSNKKVAVHLERKGDSIEITVSDQGPGIPDSEKKKIFERFYRMEKDREISGTGRGLWITKNIIEKEGGIIFITDNRKKGTVFHIVIPAFVLQDPADRIEMLSGWFGLSDTQIKKKEEAMTTLIKLQDIPGPFDLHSAVFCNLLEYLRKEKTEQEAQHFKEKMKEYKRMNSGSLKILIVDDSLYVQYYLATYLVELGYGICDYAGTGEEAVNFHKEYKPDLITLDCTMPVMSGVEAARRIHDENPATPIIFISGIGRHPQFLHDLAEFLPKNRYSVLTKPFKKEELKKKVASLLKF